MTAYGGDSGVEGFHDEESSIVVASTGKDGKDRRSRRQDDRGGWRKKDTSNGSSGCAV